MKSIRCLLAVIVVLLGAACAYEPFDELTEYREFITNEQPLVIADDVAERLARFEPVKILVNREELSEIEEKVLAELVAASRLMGEIFHRQAWAGNPDMRVRLLTSGDKNAATALQLFDVMVGPWDRLNEEPFVGGAVRPHGAGYYPSDMTEGEFNAWVAAHPDQKSDLEGLFHVVKRAADGGLVAVPYSQIYARWLSPAAAHLRRAADLTENQSLKTFLRSRAAAFSSGDYYQSDKDWMDLDGHVEVTIGPYEVYEDRMFAAKAAFESFVTVVSHDLSRKLGAYKDLLPDMEQNLPIPEAIKNPNRGTESPIRVADLFYSGGDTRSGVQTIAFNLPNDERVRKEKGSKKVILRNVMDAKFKLIMKPIAQRVLHEDHQSDLIQSGFFNETLFHELSHGLGPGLLVLNGRKTEVRRELGAIYSACEEAKADVMGAWNVLFMIERGIFEQSYRRPFLTTYFAGLFRSTRFGVAEAHGKGAALQLNYFVEKGGATRDESTGRYSIDIEVLARLIGELTRDICVMQAAGDKVGTEAFFAKYGILTSGLAATLESLTDIPVDIRPIYADD